MKINPKNISPREAFHVFVGVITPRPIAWVSTVDKQDRYNLAPFSMYSMLSTVPAIVGFGVSAYRDGKKKDTIRNIEANKEFVINVVTESLAEAMNLTSVPFPPGVSEFEKAGLTPVRSEFVAPPRVSESPVSMECRMLQILRFGVEPMINHFIIGEILLVHVRDEFCRDGMLDASLLKTIGVMGALPPPDIYCRTTDTFGMDRPEG
jgi:flavin reductase (DIM6/NTAB) family NADH-FMN oxidoreductase RutF